MSRIVLINPNSNLACSDGISAAIAPFRLPGGPILDVLTLVDGPPGIYSWQDWHAVVAPLCRFIQSETADVFVIACASDPGIEAARAATATPVLGVFRCAVAAALARCDRFGVIALADASIGRHALALRGMGVETRLAAEIAMNVGLDELLDPLATRTRLIQTAHRLADAGAQAIILGCTGMAHHREAIQTATNLPIVEPCQAAAAQAMAIA